MERLVVDRREVLKLGGLGALAAAGLVVPIGVRAGAGSASTLASAIMPRPYRRDFLRPPVLQPYEVVKDAQGRPVLERYSLTARQFEAGIVGGGLPTTMWGYNGMVPGPTISVHQNVRVEMRVRNDLPAVDTTFGQPSLTSTHLHGSASLPQFDGYASDVTQTGFYKTYEYPDFQGARTLWYHDHAVHHTAVNAYSGLAAQYHLHDDLEERMLPQGQFDVPLTISDAMFAADGSLAYDDKGVKSLWGDVILVNGVPWPVMKVKPRIYRFRILVASISRSYRLRLSTGHTMTVVATDGGMVPVPQPVTQFRASSGERYEVLVDFSKYPVGATVDLLNASNPNNVNYDHTNKVMRFQVVAPSSDDPPPYAIPADWRIEGEGKATMDLQRTGKERVTRLRLKHDDVTNVWSINGVTWDDVVASGYTKIAANPRIDEVQLWELENSSGGWFHPVHIHLVDFKIVGRNTNGGQPHPWERGPKDVVYLGEGETVRLLAKFHVSDDTTGGRYMIHCHNLVHEDHDMMTQFLVGDPDFTNDPHPIYAAPPVKDDLPEDSPTYLEYPPGV
ncbi:spore coat protein A [Cellulomonas aerilata]|uniref:Spore coat protein A n=2 Tax=Cellulomonas aerilata TaxID=515326 RepID=A0A512D7R7_9CELL|nr:spore coat protein A [Cellulomonas aerilata]